MRPINGTCYSCRKKIDTGPYGIRRYCDRFCPDRRDINLCFSRIADVISAFGKTFNDAFTPAIQAVIESLKPLTDIQIDRKIVYEDTDITAK